MNEIEKKALALVNEAIAENGMNNTPRTRLPTAVSTQVLVRAIEQHEAFRQEVSDAVKAALKCEANFQMYAAVSVTDIKAHLASFIIAKPDPLVEALKNEPFNTAEIEMIRAALAKRGLKIVEVE